MENTENHKLAFITGNRKRNKPKLIIVLPHGPLYDFLSFMCWYSFARYHEFADAALIFVGRPHNDFRTWAHKFNYPVYFMKKFHNLFVTEQIHLQHFAESYVLCMYNVFFTDENESLFEKSFINENIIFRKPKTEKIPDFDIFPVSHDELVPIVKFNFANEDLIASEIINNNTAGNPFLAEKKAPEESVNETRLELLYRRCRELYRNLMEGYYEKEI